MLKFDLIVKRLFSLILIIFISLFSPPALTKEAPKNDCRLQYINLDWWKNFEDPCLVEYILKSLENSPDANIAALKSEEYKHFVRISLGKELPHLGVSGTYVGLKTPHLSPAIPSAENNIFAVPLVMNYEADFFLKNRDKTKSVKQEYEAQKFKEKAAYILLVSSVANAYFNIVSLDENINLSKQIVKNQKEIFRRTKNKFEAGTASAIDVNKAEQSYKQAQIELNDLVKAQELFINKLAVLIGEKPSSEFNMPRISFEKMHFKGTIPKEIPSEIVFERPDVQSAESMLKKAKIDIRVARKDFLPSFNIIGAIGFSSSSDVGGFFSWNNVLGLIAANAYQSIYQGGIKVATLKLRKNQYEQMFEQYKKADLTAMQEINDSLCLIEQDSKSFNGNIAKYNLEKNNFARYKNTYDEGLISYPSYLSAQQNLLVSKKQFVNSKTQIFTDYISLYKAVGARL